jgi:hypothetical protein
MPWLIIVVFLYVPWIAVYRLLALANYKSRWRAFVPVLNILLAYDLSGLGKTAALKLLITLPVAFVAAVVYAIASSADTGIDQSTTIEFPAAVIAGLVAVALLPSLIFLPAMGAALAEKTARSRTVGMIALLPGVFLAGFPYLALTAKVNAGIPPEYVPMSQLPQMPRSPMR